MKTMRRCARRWQRDAAEIIAEQEALWLARSRPGGLKDSLARMEKMRRDYQPS